MTTTSPPRTRRRLAVPAIMLGGGGAITGAAAAGGAAAAAVGAEAGLTVIFTAVFWWAGRGRGDFGALFGSRPDERQAAVDQRATALAGLAVAMFCLVATVVSLARGGSGNPWAALDCLFAVVYLAGLVIFRR